MSGIKNWMLYSLDTGLFLPGRVACVEAALNVPDGYAALEGMFDPRTQRVQLPLGAAPVVIGYTLPAPPLAAAKGARLASLKLQLAALEAPALRPMREALGALLAGQPVPAAAKQRLDEIEAAAAPLRDKIRAILAARTQSELDVIL